ncbi:MAG: hypothetical protein GY755_25170 [Chloroflexi bacterium]|nr:hypothetical protein [Chloroflexota bacterium]
MEEEKEKADTLEAGSKPTKSIQPSALLTDPANRPVLVAKLRDDLMALRKAGFFVDIEGREHLHLKGVTITIIPIEDSLQYKDYKFVYNGKDVI